MIHYLNLFGSKNWLVSSKSQIQKESLKKKSYESLVSALHSENANQKRFLCQPHYDRYNREAVNLRI